MITVVGIGPSGHQWLTGAGKEAIETAECIIGSRRQLETLEGIQVQTIQVAYSTMQDLKAAIQRQRGPVVVLASGDPSLYGVGKFLIETFSRDRVRLIPGISSVQYLFSRCGIPMNDVYLTSAHGKVLPVDRVVRMPLTAVLTDQVNTPQRIAADLLAAGINPTITVGETLGYEEESIESFQASELAVVTKTYGLNVVIIQNEEADHARP